MQLTVTEAPAASKAGVNKRPSHGVALWLVLLSLVYLVPTCARAAHEKFWYDELLTFDAATLFPSVQKLWGFLKEAEASPPLGFLLAGASEGVFGRGEFGLRFPSIVGFWVMAVCLYFYLSRRIPRSFALAGALLAALTAAGRYSYEARPYGVMLGLGGIALVAWQAAAAGRRRTLTVPLVGLALMAALFTHPLAVTLAIPFVVGELVRTIQCKRVDWPVWCAFAAATPMLLVIWTMQATGKSTTYLRFRGGIAWHIAVTYLQMLGTAIVPLVVAFLVLLVLRSLGGINRRREGAMRAHELAALAGFALIPFAAVTLLATVDGMYFLRYSLNCTMGLAGLVTILLYQIGGPNQLSAVSVAAVFTVAFAIVQVCPEEKRPDYGLKVENSSEKIRPSMERMPADAPIAVGAPMTFVELEHYASPGLAGRLYYLTEPAVAAAIDGNTLFDLKTPALAQFFPFRSHFEDYHAFIAAHPRFYVVQSVRNLAFEAAAGRLRLEARSTSDGFEYYEAYAR